MIFPFIVYLSVVVVLYSSSYIAFFSVSFSFIVLSLSCLRCCFPCSFVVLCGLAHLARHCWLLRLAGDGGLAMSLSADWSRRALRDTWHLRCVPAGIGLARAALALPVRDRQPSSSVWRRRSGHRCCCPLRPVASLVLSALSPLSPPSALPSPLRPVVPFVIFPILPLISSLPVLSYLFLQLQSFFSLLFFSSAVFPCAALWPGQEFVVCVLVCQSSASSRYCLVISTVVPPRARSSPTIRHSASRHARVQPGGRLVQNSTSGDLAYQFWPPLLAVGACPRVVLVVLVALPV